MSTKRVNKTKYAILGALSFKPMSGYDIKNWLLQVISSFWSESDGQIYPTLIQLLNNKLIKRLDDVGIGGSKRQRKVYEITREGVRFLKTWLAAPAQEDIIRSEFVLKLFNGKNLTKKDYIAHLKRKQEQAKQELKFYLTKQEHIKNEHNNINGFYWLQTLKSGIYHAKADIAWCKDTLKTIMNK
jgi:PadR family transcriptional regulator, regulatory protein AphA